MVAHLAHLRGGREGRDEAETRRVRQASAVLLLARQLCAAQRPQPDPRRCALCGARPTAPRSCAPPCCARALRCASAPRCPPAQPRPAHPDLGSFFIWGPKPYIAQPTCMSTLLREATVGRPLPLAILVIASCRSRQVGCCRALPRPWHVKRSQGLCTRGPWPSWPSPPLGKCGWEGRECRLPSQATPAPGSSSGTAAGLPTRTARARGAAGCGLPAGQRQQPPPILRLTLSVRSRSCWFSSRCLSVMPAYRMTCWREGGAGQADRRCGNMQSGRPGGSGCSSVMLECRVTCWEGAGTERSGLVHFAP